MSRCSADCTGHAAYFALMPPSLERRTKYPRQVLPCRYSAASTESGGPDRASSAGLTRMTVIRGEMTLISIRTVFPTTMSQSWSPRRFPLRSAPPGLVDCLRDSVGIDLQKLVENVEERTALFGRLSLREPADDELADVGRVVAGFSAVHLQEPVGGLEREIVDTVGCVLQCQEQLRGRLRVGVRCDEVAQEAGERSQLFAS